MLNKLGFLLLEMTNFHYSYSGFGGPILIEVDCTHLDLLSPDEMRFFWLRWYGDSINFGYGSVVDANKITGYAEPLPDLKAVALYGYEQNVKYEVRNIAGKDIFVHLRIQIAAEKMVV